MTEGGSDSTSRAGRQRLKHRCGCIHACLYAQALSCGSSGSCVGSQPCPVVFPETQIYVFIYKNAILLAKYDHHGNFYHRLISRLFYFCPPLPQSCLAANASGGRCSAPGTASAPRCPQAALSRTLGLRHPDSPAHIPPLP